MLLREVDYSLREKAVKIGCDMNNFANSSILALIHLSPWSATRQFSKPANSVLEIQLLN